MKKTTVLFKGEEIEITLLTRREYIASLLDKSGFLSCGRCGSNKPSDVHHIIFKSECPGEKTLQAQGNLILLCRSCHEWFHKEKKNRDDLVKERQLWIIFPHLIYLIPTQDESIQDTTATRSTKE